MTGRLSGMGSLLFVLDNAEHLRDLLQPRLQAWAEIVPSLQIVVTSRVRMGSRLEHVHELRPLAAEAEVLFLDRALRAGADLGPVGSNEDVAAIVELLDGMPLSLELAASRLTVLSVAQLRERLERDLTSLRGTPGMFPARHRRLAATLELSFSMLTPTAMHALELLSVLPDGFSLESAAQVMGLSPDDVEDVVYELRANSLLRVDDVEGRRFRFFFSVKQLASERHQRHDELRTTIQEWAAGLGRTWWAVEIGQGRERPDLESERYNLLYAAALLADSGQVDDACAVLCGIASSMSRYVNPEFSRLLETLAASAGPRDDDLHAAVIAHRATQLRIAGDTRGAAEWAHRAVQRARCNNTPAVLALARHKLAVSLWRLGELDRALELFEWCAEARGRLGHAGYEASSRGGVAILHHAAGRLEEAEEAYAATIRAGGDDPTAASPVAVALSNRAHLYWDTGRHSEARAGLLAAIDLAERSGMDRYSGIVRLELARLTLLTGDPDEGMILLNEATVQVRNGAGTMEQGIALGVHAIAMLRQGQEARAVELATQGVALLRTCADHESLSVSLMWFGTTLCAVDRIVDAEQVFDEVAELLATVDRPGLEHALAVHRCQVLIANGAHDAARDAVAAQLAAAGIHRDNSEVHAASTVVDDALRRRIEAVAEGGDTLLLPADANWFQLGDAERVVLKRRRAPRYILACLAQHRVLAPGEALSLWDLADAGWPGEDLHPDVASNRVYVALATLRKLGLEDALVRRGGGYAIAPELNVVLLSDTEQAVHTS